MKKLDGLKLGAAEDENQQVFGLYLPKEDRSTHVYVLGSSGVGKSKALARWVVEDIRNRRGCGAIDPHGDMIRDVIGNLPLEYLDDVILIDLTDPEYIVGFNPLEQQPGINPYTQALELVEVFRKIWELSDATAPRLIEILRNSVYTLIEAGGTMLDIEPLLTNQSFREEMIRYVKNEAVGVFWRDRFARWEQKDRIANVESTLNKVSAFTSDPRIRLMLSAKKSTIDFRTIMDTGRVLLINLSKGALRTNSYLLGALFIAKIQMAAMSRENLPSWKRIPWYLYVDEFQNYATESFAEILSEARKYGLSITLAHQSLTQLPLKLRDIILGNAKNLICFRLDRQDAELMVRYVNDIDPFAWKLKEEEKYTFFTVQEQWEEGISGLTSLPTSFAILKTKGAEWIAFITYPIEDNANMYKEALDIIRERNFNQGFVLQTDKLVDELTFQPSAVYNAHEPDGYLE